MDDVYGNEDDIENIHVFDEQGRAVCIYSKAVDENKVLGATACTYEADTASDGTENIDKRNKIKDTAIVGMHTNNLLQNHSFEYNDSSWTLYKNEDGTPESGAVSARNPSKKYIGSYCAYFNMAKRTDGTAGLKQEVTLAEGTYTFSGYCSTKAIENTAAYLKVRTADGSTYYSNKVTEETSAAFDDGWERLDITFTITSGQTVTVYLETDCESEKGAGTVYFDCVQLERGNVANDYNILEDGSFELTEETLPYNWKNLDNSTIKVKDERVSGGVDGEDCYHITGQPGKDKYLKVTANLGSAKNSFVLSGWIKTNSTPIRKGRDFKVTAVHSEEDYTLSVSNDINAYSEGWKYFCMIIPAGSWKSTTFTIRFYDNIGDLYIDGLQLTRNDVQTKKYDSSGRVTTKYTSLKSTSYGCDSYDRMNKQTSAAGAVSTYTYAGNNELTKIAANIGPDVNMLYDKYGNKISDSVYDPASTKLQYYSETAYTEDGNFEKSTTDNAGNVTSYEYNTFTGQLEKTILPARDGEEPVETDYVYDSEDRISEVNQSGRKVTYQYGEFDDLTGITHNGFSYNYTYDGFGNVLTASIAGTTICTNEYAPNNGSHVKSVYPDGTETGTTYDEYGKITSNSLDGITISKYVYDNDGNVARKTDALAGVTTKYDYNDSDMLVRSEVYKGESTASEDFESRMQYTYTQSGQVGTLSYQEKDSDVRTYTYTYATDEKPIKSLLPDKSYTNWYYDSLRRNNKIIHVPKNGAADAKKLYTTLEYQASEFTVDGKVKNTTTNLVSLYTNKFGNTGKAVSEFAYTYDAWGNITEIEDTIVNTKTSVNEEASDDTESGVFLYEEDIPALVSSGTNEGTGSLTATGSTSVSELALMHIQPGSRTYAYNDYGEVISAYEAYSVGIPRKYTYTYDEGGNILAETINGKTHTYVYDAIWKDKLISYDGKTITYDVFGCPIDYMGTAMTWDIYGGLTSVDNGTDDISYTYMGDGQRRTKTVNGTTTTYHYNNGMLLSETTGDETLRYYYDSTGKVATIVYKKGDGEERSYFYTRNAQGDIIGIYRSSDSTLIGTYEYDLWGKLIVAKEAESGIDTDGILTKNPFRYRGYYYDNETGFYYLNARYYDPQIRRFISADSMNVLMIATTDISCKNLFSYSENNPVTGKDSSGAIVETVFDIVSLAGSIVDVYNNPNDPLAWAGLVGDAVDLIPCVTGVGEIIRGARTVAIVAGAAGSAAGVAVGATKLSKKVENAVDGFKNLAKGLSNPKNVFPDNPDDLLPTISRNKVAKTNGTISQTIYTSDSIRIRAEKHPLLSGEKYNPRHHGVHYHVEYKVDSKKSWNNKNNVKKCYPEGYKAGEGTGFIPGETFPK